MKKRFVAATAAADSILNVGKAKLNFPRRRKQHLKKEREKKKQPAN